MTNYFRLEGKCIKLEDGLRFVVIEIPAEGEHLPLIHKRDVFASEEQKEEVINTMTEAEPRVWNEFLGAFFRAAKKNEEVWNNHVNPPAAQPAQPCCEKCTAIIPMEGWLCDCDLTTDQLNEVAEMLKVWRTKNKQASLTDYRDAHNEIFLRMRPLKQSAA